jgi:hypothetical protein
VEHLVNTVEAVAPWCSIDLRLLQPGVIFGQQLTGHQSTDGKMSIPTPTSSSQNQFDTTELHQTPPTGHARLPLQQ